MVRRPVESGHDGALSRAVHELGIRSRSCSPASRSSASRREAAISRPATGITWCWRSGCARGYARPGESPSSSRCTPSRRREGGRRRPWTAISLTSGLVEILFGYPIDGVVLTIGCDKTTPACAHGGGDGEHPRDRALGRAHAERLAQGASASARARSSGRPGSGWRRARSTTADS